MKRLVVALLLGFAAAAQAQPCPARSIVYWLAFAPGGESDAAARDQRAVLKRRCPAIDTILQYRAGAQGASMWAQVNALPAEGFDVVGIDLPRIVLQPIESPGRYRTTDIAPVFWFHFTPDALVVRDASPYKTIQELLAAARQGPLRLGGNGLYAPSHIAQARLNASFGVSTRYVPFPRTSELTSALLGESVDGAMTFVAYALNNRGRVRALAVAMEERHPLLPDVPTFRELGIDWVDGAFRGIGVPAATPPEARQRLAELWTALNVDPQMQELATRSGFELVNVGPDKMEAFMAARARLYTDAARRLGLLRP